LVIRFVIARLRGTRHFFSPMKLSLPVALSFTLALPALAENWPQWRGPNLDGTSPEKNLPVTWSAEKGVKWKTPMPGFSGATPIVWGDSIFVSSPDENKNLLLLCLNKKDGAIRWKQQLGEGDINKGRGNMASPSPVTDGKTVWVLYGTGDLAALDFQGQVRWKRNLGADYGRFSINWIYGSSPLLFDGRLYVQVLQRSPAPPDYPGIAGTAGERESYLLALDPQTGKTLWKQARPSDAQLESLESYATPVPHRSGGRTQLLIAGGDFLSGHDPATGRELWRGFGINPQRGEWMRLVPSPVSAGDLAIVCGPKKQAMIAFRTDLTGDITEKGVAWKFDEMKTPDVCTPVYWNGKLFALDGDSHTLTCFEAKSGQKLWQGEVPERGTVIRASPTLADGRLYIVNEKGTTHVIDATANEFKLLATNALPDESNARGTIAVSDGLLFLRGTQYLYCIGK
jgi:outer membrane protein assembly factor BamB